MKLPDSAILNNLLVPGMHVPDNGFEKKYLACRIRENRIYTDEEVIRLPDCASAHPHYPEWQLRKVSSGKLVRYLQAKKRPLTVLEIGCGNGWLSHRLSGLSRSRVTGIDINFTELQQAARVFNDCHKLKFIYGDIRSGILDNRKYDIILFAASIQYFKSVDSVLELCLQHLQDEGEIHITDTRLYPSRKEAMAARQRTERYYADIGFPDMARYYFHHSLHSIAQFNHELRYDPFALHNRLLRKQHPFHWVIIKNDGHV